MDCLCFLFRWVVIHHLWILCFLIQVRLPCWILGCDGTTMSWNNSCKWNFIKQKYISITIRWTRKINDISFLQPFIEEFNYPVPKNCAGGDTGVLVNGRELHQKDLDLLVGRGLPRTRGTSYIIEISGKVWDESSGEELDGLGKLAPT
ncbi:hypothetical protein GW17_00023124 [Ensete ventricosum]|nr:hypothetical protein GW17_00023124 [Ensete ventricosum]